MTVAALLLAAGAGERLGGDRPKAFARLGDRALLAESLERLDASEWLDTIVLAAAPGWEEPSILLAEEVGASKVVACVTGGETRSASARVALAEVPDDVAVVLVHDAARPIVGDDVIERVLAPFSEGWDGVVPALRIADTVKRVRGDQVVETLDRSELVAVQTPQAFLAPVLRHALSSGGDAGDCAALVEARGGRIRVVDGDRRLVKVTTADDLALVATWL